eukprot:GHRR01005292.1.p1 GENE.GHRR01005292.1~~GHRR01005292.1.p1  ORF type:complete len:859 (+),score=362.03 GHRR01005292.1:904-3480(+)
MDKATADAAELKAGFDRLTMDTYEQKAQLDKVAADAAEYKACFDKVTSDAAEYKAGFDKMTADAAEYKASVDKITADAAEYKEQMNRMAVDMSTVQEQLLRERENFSSLHDQHAQLLRQQEVLAAELMVALGNYKPKANIDAGTPADKLLQMITDLLDGSLPNLQDILLIQSSILEARDIYQPWRLGKQLLETKELDESVGLSLVHLLGDTETLQQTRTIPQPVSLQELCASRKTPPRASSRTPSVSDLSQLDNAPTDLQSMLVNIVAAPSSQTLMIARPRSQHASRRRSSNTSAGALWAAHMGVPAYGSGNDEDARFAAATNPSDMLLVGRASSMLQQLAMRRHGSSHRSGSLGSAAGNDKASAAAMRHSGANNGVAAGASSGDSTVEDNAPTTDEDDTSTLDGNGAASESACGSSVVANGDAGAGAIPSSTSGWRAAKPEPPVVVEQLEAVLASAMEWQFDAFALTEASSGHPLSTLGYYLFHKHGLIEQFNLKPACLARFLRRMEEGYKQNPYHNAMHAADVLQTYNVIIHRGGLVPGYVEPLHMMACFTAAVVHDFEHGGLTNDFLVNSLDNLAVLYNDRSPLENHHLAAAFMLLRQPEFNYMSSLPKADFDKFRKVVIELVLATDMKQHFSILSHFTTVHRLNAGGTLTPGTSGSDALMALRHPGRSDNSNSANSGAVDQDKIVLPLDETERILGLQMALKCADLGHVTAALPVHIRWVDQLEEEFFRQGDVERHNCMSISPLFDRSKQGITKSQVGFFDIVVIPLFHTFGKVFGNCRPLLTYVMRNYRYWADVQTQQSEQPAQDAPTSGGIKAAVAAAVAGKGGVANRPASPMRAAGHSYKNPSPLSGRIKE